MRPFFVILLHFFIIISMNYHISRDIVKYSVAFATFYLSRLQHSTFITIKKWRPRQESNLRPAA